MESSFFNIGDISKLTPTQCITAIALGVAFVGVVAIKAITGQKA